MIIGINYIYLFVILTLLIIQVITLLSSEVLKKSIEYRNFYRPKNKVYGKSYSLLAANHLDLLQDLDDKSSKFNSVHIDLTDNYSVKH